MKVLKFGGTSVSNAEKISDFFRELEKHDDHFLRIQEEAARKNKKLSYIAIFENGIAKISLEQIDNQDPFYTLTGSDNIIAFSTTRYKDAPLVIKGAGAGAEVTAGGVMADIFKIATAVLRRRSF